MAVQNTEVYGDVLKVILKPTKNFPEGYFYTDNNEVARQLVESHTWYLLKQNKNIYVVAHTGTSNIGQNVLQFHQEYAKKILSYYPNYLDHINGIEYDNRNDNLNEVTQQQNMRNRPSIGYQINAGSTCFAPYYVLKGKILIKDSYKTEPEALLVTYNLREQEYKDYNYNFLEDRRGFNILLSQELEGIITHEEATYQRVKTLVKHNPWYVYRYNLFDYCKQNNIIIPKFELDSQGFMINPVTKQRFCPY